jgi:excisionase family DNA binding protein
LAVKRPSRQVEWLPLGAASRLIGVDPDTLRRWADQGRIDHLVTPGGHRRFRRTALEPLVRAASQDSPDLGRLGATPDRLARIYRHRYQGNAGPAFDRLHLGPADRDLFRVEGRSLVTLLLRHLERANETAGPQALAEAATLVRRLGARLARRGTSLTDAVGLFIEARRPFLVELGAMASRRRLRPDQLARLYERASGAFDLLLLELIEGHRTTVENRNGRSR